jgi:biopolymer transport protein ExbD
VEQNLNNFHLNRSKGAESMNYLLEVCLVALTFANGITPSSVAQASAATPENSSQTEPHVIVAQTKQKGISVELPVAANAVPVPKAENDASLIVTVTYNGSVYLGVNPISPAELAEKVRSALSSKAEKTLYIKADSRGPYASLIKVLDSVRPAGVEGLTLLIAQRDGEQPGSLVLPKGLEMLVVSPRPGARSASGTKGR